LISTAIDGIAVAVNRTRGTRKPVSPSPARFRSTIANVVDQPDDLRDLRRIYKVLADVNRLRLLRALADGPATVTELVETVGLSQPLVSWHLGKLREVGLAKARRQGRVVVHTIVPEAFDALRVRETRALGLSADDQHGRQDQ
jgi:DNA-binding transcriptional ArsR family regulator